MLYSFIGTHPTQSRFLRIHCGNQAFTCPDRCFSHYINFWLTLILRCYSIWNSVSAIVILLYRSMIIGCWRAEVELWVLLLHRLLLSNCINSLNRRPEWWILSDYVLNWVSRWILISQLLVGWFVCVQSNGTIIITTRWPTTIWLQYRLCTLHNVLNFIEYITCSSWCGTRLSIFSYRWSWFVPKRTHMLFSSLSYDSFFFLGYTIVVIIQMDQLLVEIWYFHHLAMFLWLCCLRHRG